MSGTTPAGALDTGRAPCPVPWCPIEHDQGALQRAHRLELGPFPGPDPAVWPHSAETRLTLMQIDEDDEPGTPFVRVEFHVYGQPRVMEVSTALAGDLGDLLATQQGAVHRTLSSALVGTYWLTGGGE